MDIRILQGSKISLQDTKAWHHFPGHWGRSYALGKGICKITQNKDIFIQLPWGKPILSLWVFLGLHQLFYTGEVKWKEKGIGYGCTSVAILEECYTVGFASAWTCCASSPSHFGDSSTSQFCSHFPKWLGKGGDAAQCIQMPAKLTVFCCHMCTVNPTSLFLLLPCPENHPSHYPPSLLLTWHWCTGSATNEHAHLPVFVLAVSLHLPAALKKIITSCGMCWIQTLPSGS